MMNVMGKFFKTEIGRHSSWSPIVVSLPGQYTNRGMFDLPASHRRIKILLKGARPDKYRQAHLLAALAGAGMIGSAFEFTPISSSKATYPDFG